MDVRGRMGLSYGDMLVAAASGGVPVPAEPGDPQGYFARPERTLDPRVIAPDGMMRDDVRQAVMRMLYDFWNRRYNAAESWSTVWIAGSALAWQWDRAGADLDVLVGVDMAAFLANNLQFSGLNESTISTMFNKEFRAGLQPNTDEVWFGPDNGPWEITFYVNPGARDIRDINPYAAYDLTHDEWTVSPLELPPDWDPVEQAPEEWWAALRPEIDHIKEMAASFNAQLEEASRWPSGHPRRVNAEAKLEGLAKEAGLLFEAVHSGRKIAFSKSGAGYADFNNFRWQAHKRAGTIKVVHALTSFRSQAEQGAQVASYGQPILGPDNMRAIASLQGTPYARLFRGG